MIDLFRLKMKKIYKRYYSDLSWLIYKLEVNDRVVNNILGDICYIYKVDGRFLIIVYLVIKKKVRFSRNFGYCIWYI